MELVQQLDGKVVDVSPHPHSPKEFRTKIQVGPYCFGIVSDKRPIYPVGSKVVIEVRVVE